MISTESTPLEPATAKPPRLAHLLDLYERNFRLAEQLLPELELPFEQAVSKSGSDLPLHLQVLERERYTVTLRLTYEFVDQQGLRRQPDIVVRIYRDAGVAEALECNQRPPFQARDESDPMVQAYLGSQWQRNLMLGKWLEYLLDHGHGFGMAHRPRILALA